MAVTSHLKSFQALELAVRSGSLTAAAHGLSITPAAVGQRIKALEDYLGIDLLTRSRSGLKPTAALEAALPHLVAAFRELSLLADALDMQRGEEIHVAAPPDFADLWLAPRLHRFRKTFPGAKFNVNGEGDAKLRLAPVDCAITFGPRGDQANTDALFRDFVLPISSPENTARIGKLERRVRLEGFPLLHLDFYRDDPAVPSWPEWIRAQRLRRTAPERGIRFQRIVHVLEAVFANAGLTLCGLALVRDGVDAGRVSLPFPMASGTWTKFAFHARYRSDSLQRPQIRRFRDWLADESRTMGAWLDAKVGSKRRRRQGS